VSRPHSAKSVRVVAEEYSMLEDDDEMERYLTFMPYMYALYVCIFMPPCLISMPYMTAKSALVCYHAHILRLAGGRWRRC